MITRILIMESNKGEILSAMEEMNDYCTMEEQNDFGVMDELKYLLMEIDDMAYQERKEYKEELEEMLAEIQREPGQSELSGEQRLLLAKGLCELASIYKAEIGYTVSDGERAWELFMQAREIYDKEFGKGSEDSWRLALYLSVIAIDRGIHQAEIMQILQEMLAINEENPEADVVRITDTYKRMAEISSQWEQDTDKAITYYQPYLKWAREKYGEESDFVADCYEEIARLCENCNDILRACEYTERALAINIREMGKMYLLPAVLRKTVVGFMKMIGKIDEESKFSRIMSASDSYCNLGECYLRINEAQRAKDCLKKSVMLYEMVMRVSTYDHGWGHELLGDALLILGKKEKAWQEYRTAQLIYRAVMKSNMESDDDSYGWETEECQEGLERLSSKLQQNAE